MKSKLIYYFCCAFLLGFSIRVNAQKAYLPASDSLVISETEEYEEDTLSLSAVEEKTYHKGNPVSLLRIQCLGKNKCCDSTITKTYYLQGKKHKEKTRTVSCELWPIELLTYEDSENVDSPGNSKNETQEHYQTRIRIYNHETVFLDSMTVSHGAYAEDEEGQLFDDTIKYCFNNRFFKYSSTAQNSSISSSKRKDYLFEKEGKLTGFVTVYTNLTGTFTCEEAVKLSKKDTLTLERKWENDRHTGKTTMNERWDYNENNQVVNFEEMNNGKVTKQISWSYHENGAVKSKKTLFEDGRESTNYYWWKHEAKRQQLWCHLESPFSFEKQGEFYNLTDTSFVDGKMTIKIYEFQIEGKSSDCSPQVLADRLPMIQSEYDEKNRLIFSSTRDLESGKFKKIRYRYKTN